MPAKKVTPRGKAAPPPESPPKAKKPAAKKKAPAKKRASTKRYIRAIYSPAGGTRLVLSNESKFQLMPRGQIGDLAPVTKDDMSDPIYVQNKDVIFEEISEAEAKVVMEKQTTNQQAHQGRSSVMDHIRDEYDQPIKGDVTVEKAFEQQGQTVASIENAAPGRFTDGHQGLITRSEGGMEPDRQEVPGSTGHHATPDGRDPRVPADVPPEQAADWLARNADAGAHDLLKRTDRELPPTDF